LVFVALGITIALMSVGLGLGSLERPGPGFWPFMVSAGTTLVAALATIRAEPVEITTNVQLKRVALLVAGLAGFLVLFEPVGFLLSAAILLFYLLRIISRTSWSQSFVIGVIGAAATYFVFSVALGVRLPTGPWF